MSVIELEYFRQIKYVFMRRLEVLHFDAKTLEYKNGYWHVNGIKFGKTIKESLIMTRG